MHAAPGRQDEPDPVVVPRPSRTGCSRAASLAARARGMRDPARDAMIAAARARLRSGALDAPEVYLEVARRLLRR